MQKKWQGTFLLLFIWSVLQTEVQVMNQVNLANLCLSIAAEWDQLKLFCHHR
jgi:hypothetical protein